MSGACCVSLRYLAILLLALVEAAHPQDYEAFDGNSVTDRLSTEVTARACMLNVCDGAPGQRRSALTRWLHRHVFDPSRGGGVAALCECNGWDEAEVERLATECGASSGGVLMACPTGYHMALLR